MCLQFADLPHLPSTSDLTVKVNECKALEAISLLSADNKKLRLNSAQCQPPRTGNGWNKHCLLCSALLCSALTVSAAAVGLWFKAIVTMLCFTSHPAVCGIILLANGNYEWYPGQIYSFCQLTTTSRFVADLDQVGKTIVPLEMSILLSSLAIYIYHSIILRRISVFLWYSFRIYIKIWWHLAYGKNVFNCNKYILPVETLSTLYFGTPVLLQQEKDFSKWS